MSFIKFLLVLVLIDFGSAGGKLKRPNLFSFLGQQRSCLYNELVFKSGDVADVDEDFCTQLVCRMDARKSFLNSRALLQLEPIEDCICSIQDSNARIIKLFDGLKNNPRKGSLFGKGSQFGKVSKFGSIFLQNSLLAKKKFEELLTVFTWNRRDGCYFNSAMVKTGTVAASLLERCAELICHPGDSIGENAALELILVPGCRCDQDTTTTEEITNTTEGMTTTMEAATTTDGMTTTTEAATTTEGMITTTEGATTTGGITTTEAATTTEGMTTTEAATTTEGMTTTTEAATTTEGMTGDSRLAGRLGVLSACAEYQHFGFEHTMCLPTNAECGIVEAGISEEEKDRILSVHNFIRAWVATGREPRGSPGPQPRGANVRQLVWNQELADIAQAWANTCPSGHDSYDGRTPISRPYALVGQNMFYQFGTPLGISFTSTSLKAPIDIWDSAINSWGDEVESVDTQLVRSYDVLAGNETIGHYSQVMWAETSEIGCGRVQFRNCTTNTGFVYPVCQTIVCNYGEAGNFIDSPVYIVGNPASLCQNGESIAYPGLCA